MPADVVIVFPPPADPLSMNDGHGREQGRAKQAWRDRAYFAWCEAHPAVGPSARSFGAPADLRVSLPFTTARRRDSINFARTVKAIGDGFTLAGAWPDDTDEFVTQHLPSLRRDPGGLVVIRVTERNP